VAPPRQRRAVATAIEQREGDQVLGLAKAEGHAVEHPQLGVCALDQRVGQVMEHGRLDAGDVLLDLLSQLDEGADSTALRPDEPFVSAFK
jgi:hypothetical protein